MNLKSKEAGFSLIEAMIATFIIGVSFAGVYSLTAFSVKNLSNSADKQRMQMVANQMMEIIDSDQENIDNYNMDFTTCVAPTSDETEDYHQYRYKWCRMLNNYLGVPVSGDEREITITAISAGERLVNVKLQNQQNGVEINVKRLFSIN